MIYGISRYFFSALFAAVLLAPATDALAYWGGSGNNTYTYTGPEGANGWSDSAARVDVADNAPAKTVDVKHSYPVNWKDLARDLNDKIPKSTIEKTKSIPWSDVARGAGKTISRIGGPAAAAAGLALLLIDEGIKICNDGGWCTEQQATPNTQYGETVVGAATKGRGYQLNGESPIAPTPCQSGCAYWQNCTIGPGGWQKIESNLDNGVCALTNSFGAVYYYQTSIKDGYLLPVPITPADVEKKIASNTNPNIEWSKVATDVMQLAPDLAESETQPHVKYDGPSTVTSEPQTQTQTQTAPDGSTTTTTNTTTQTINIVYGDTMTITNVRNETATTTQTTSPGPDGVMGTPDDVTTAPETETKTEDKEPDPTIPDQSITVPKLPEFPKVRTYTAAVQAFQDYIKSSDGLFGTISKMTFSGSGQCPTTSLSMFGQVYAFDYHCTLFDSVAGILGAAMLAVYSISGIFIIMRA